MNEEHILRISTDDFLDKEEYLKKQEKELNDRFIEQAKAEIERTGRAFGTFTQSGYYVEYDYNYFDNVVCLDIVKLAPVDKTILFNYTAKNVKIPVMDGDDVE